MLRTRGWLLAAARSFALIASIALAPIASAAPVAQSEAEGAPHRADTAHPDARAIVDRVAVRFFAPETGGATHPRFISERILAFEARLDAMSEDRAEPTHAVDERHLRNALDRHVAEELLATLGETSARTSADVAQLGREARAEVEQRVGGDGPVGIAGEEEGLDGDEVQEVFTRRARAAAYLDRAVARFLHPQDEQLREVFRTSQHPFKGRPYEDVKPVLTRWFVFERLKALESAFLQTARARVTVVVIPR